MLAPTSVVGLASLAALIAPAAANLNYVFTAGSYSGISGPGYDGESGQNSGFALVTESGENLYDESYVNDHVPCFNSDPASRLEVSSSCWAGPITFHCKSDGAALPVDCSADYEYNHFEGSSDSSTDFIGIAIGRL